MSINKDKVVNLVKVQLKLQNICCPSHFPKLPRLLTVPGWLPAVTHSVYDFTFPGTESSPTPYNKDTVRVWSPTTLGFSDWLVLVYCTYQCCLFKTQLCTTYVQFVMGKTYFHQNETISSLKSKKVQSKSWNMRIQHHNSQWLKLAWQLHGTGLCP